MFKKEIKDLTIKFLVVLIILTGLFIFIFASKDSIIESTRALSNTTIPLLGNGEQYEILAQKLEDFNFYVQSQWYAKNSGQFIPFISIIFAFSIFALETDKKTFYFLLNIIDRKKIFFIKTFSVFFMIFLLMLIIFFMPLIFAFNNEFNILLSIRYLISFLIGAFLWGSISIFFSIFFNDSLKSFFSSIIALTLTTIIGIMPLFNFFNTFLYVLNPFGSSFWLFTFLYLILGVTVLLFSRRYFLNKDL
jgi:ABC-type transport system involved in multi-copper enzyme maturation permease subunit